MTLIENCASGAKKSVQSSGLQPLVFVSTVGFLVAATSVVLEIGTCLPEPRYTVEDTAYALAGGGVLIPSGTSS